MSKNIISLRNHLFDALNRLAEASCEDDLKREIDKSSSIVHVADAIIRTAQVENQFIQLTNGIGSGFIPLLNNDEQPKKLSELAQSAKEEQPIMEMFNSEEIGNPLINDGK